MPSGHYDARLYQSTHLTGGAIMGVNPRNSAINRVLAELGCPQPVRLRSIRLPAEPGIQSHRPPGWPGVFSSAEKLRDEYLKSPGPLVAA